MNFTKIGLYDLLKYDGYSLNKEEYKSLMKNKCYIDSDYVGEHHKGSIFTIELIHNNEIDIYVK